VLANLRKRIYSLIRICRWRVVRTCLDGGSKTLLDVGCRDLFFHDLLKNKYQVTAADLNPVSEVIKMEDIQKMSFADKSFDIVLCQEVLEHVPDPVSAMRELKRVTGRQLIVTVPNEPLFTIYRFFVWEKEHLWAITPRALKLHLGQPAHERTIVLGRYYLGVWRFDADPQGRQEGCPSPMP
jgi:SAM-dependent methyltransferase